MRESVFIYEPVYFLMISYIFFETLINKLFIANFNLHVDFYA